MFWDKRLEDLVEFAAMRTFEIAEFDDGYLGVGGAGRGIAFEPELLEVVGVGIRRGIKHFAAEERLAVLADEDDSGVGLLVDGNSQRDLIEVRRGRGGQRP